MTLADTPQTPCIPPSDGDLFDRLRLLRSRRVGPATYHRLMAEHGTAADALLALPDLAQAAGVSDYRICPAAVISAELRAARAAGARLIATDDPDYPAALADMADAPPLLWTLGNPALLTRPMIAMVGARNASSLGTRMARKLAADLTEAGYVVVSGLARGVDAAAHLAALDGGTVAVQAGGVDVIYPSENAELAHAIADRGLRLSEMPMGLQPQARHFPARNRIIAGLSRAVVVVEAAAKSGSLITARNALDQHRDVLAVPGHPFDARAAGCNMLIRDGATLVRSVHDILEALGPVAAPAQLRALADNVNERAAIPTDSRCEVMTHVPTAPPARDLASAARLHEQILARLGPSPMAEDQLIRDLSAKPMQVAPALVDLELDGKIMRQPGGLLSRIA
ncbi:DNA-processing protein DprA [Loktanella sp. TSTF-M6]|uniref:DNA-processing protein DprA n=1 Tax=Loktanella gaetbuli TaxID=2881335 RepID=A0ABS8BWP8_9RHOB|nr:DNA-processing protein DprA [Loktanella gaetbuli]MCB5200124.1 DNA-processing protein DprA [Loktanella gaetbuli]